MNSRPKLNLPSCSLRVKKDVNGASVWSRARRAWVKLTPEEWVRCHLVEFFTTQYTLPSSRIHEEVAVELGGTAQRADIIIYDNNGTPMLLVECKAPEVPIDDAVLAQAVRYNSVIGAPYIILSNGLTHYIYKKEEEGHYAPLKSFDQLPL